MGRQFAISTETGLAQSVGKIPRKGSRSDAQVMRAIRSETFGDPPSADLRVCADEED
jgi:hypothetical protein